MFSVGPSTVSPSTSGIATKFSHPPVVVIPSAPAAQVDSSPAIPTIASFDLESCEEIPYSAMNQCIDLEENKENTEDLSDKDMINYMQLFEKKYKGRHISRLYNQQLYLQYNDTEIDF